MDPQVRFCRSADGVRIAYTITGGGPPLVLLSESSASHVRLEWQHPLFGPAFHRLAERFTLIRFDPRGSGLSDRVPLRVHQSRVADLQAVVEACALEGFSLTAINAACSTALIFASDRPGVERIVLIDPAIPRRMEDAAAPLRALWAAAKEDFAVATDIIGSLVFGATGPEAPAYGAYIRECIGPEFFNAPPPTSIGQSCLRTFSKQQQASQFRLSCSITRRCRI